MSHGDESRALTYVELDMDRCQEVYGVAPCAAALGTTGTAKCFNTRPNCQDPDNYNPAPFTYRFAVATDYLPADIPCIPNIDSVNTAPTKLNPGKDIGQRESITITFRDHPYHDIGIDKYAQERISGAAFDDPADAYDPMDRGTFWGRWRNRNRYYLGRKLRLKQGHVGQSLSEMETRHYVIETVQGPSDDGVFRITAKDSIKLVDRERAQAPQASPGELKNAIGSGDAVTEIELTNAVISDYPTSGRVRVNEEVFEYTGTTDLTASNEIRLDGVTRADLNTVAGDHDAGDAAQEVLSYEGVRASDIVTDLLTNYTLVDPSEIDTTKWNAEDDEFIGRLYTGHVTEPTGVGKLLNELSEQCGFYIWSDVTVPVIRFRAIRTPGTTGEDVTDDNMVGRAPTPKEQPDKRVSQVWVFFGRRNPTLELDEGDSFRSVAITVDGAAGGNDEYGQPAIKKVFARWIDPFNKPAALDVGDRILQRFRDPPRAFEFAKEYFDPNLKAGDLFNFTSRVIQGADGLPDTRRSIVLSFEREQGRTRVEAEEFNYTPPPDPGEKLVIIDSDTFDFNLREQFDQIYPNVEFGDNVRLLIEAGVVAGASASGNIAVDIGGWPSGVNITVENKGRIQGAGGDGGSGGADGEDGGTALFTRYAITLDNNEIWAGGGGGGSATASNDDNQFVSAPGGGGAGTDFGEGGDAIFSNVDDAEDGTATSGGAGSTHDFPAAGMTAEGGDGGGIAQAGQNGSVSGTTSSETIGSGGAAGAAIDGDSFVTYSVTGDIQGSQVN